MEEHVEHGTPGTQLAQANERSSSDSVTSPAAQIGTNLANLNVAAADGGRADSSLLGLERLLDLPFDLGADTRGQAGFSEPSFPSFDDDDLPAPSFHDDDLPVPVFHDDDLPAPLLHEHDFPADLTAYGLGDLLGLELSGFARPTVGEVVQTAFRQAQARRAQPEEDENTEDDQDEETEAEPENTDVETPDSSSASGEAGDLSFIDPQSLTEKAETNNADAASGDQTDTEIFGLDVPLSVGEGETDEGLDAEFGLSAALLRPTIGGESGSGDGVTVINGTAGDDTLAGTSGNDIVHGFAGNDVIDGGAGSDRLDGGQGDDVLVWDSADAKVDGKNGSDTLRVDGDDADFTTFAGKLSGLEIVDLQNDATITLSAQDVLEITDNNNTLAILGDTGDGLHAGSGWSYGGVDGGGNHIYSQAVGSQTATLVVDPVISVNANILV